MKILDDFIDLVLLIAVLGMMLPCLFGTLYQMQNMNNWGFRLQEDKTATVLRGDTADVIANENAMTAAEVILFVANSGNERIAKNKIMLPNGVIITVDDKFAEDADKTASALKTSLNANSKYQITFDYKSDVWRVIAI